MKVGKFEGLQSVGDVSGNVVKIGWLLGKRGVGYLYKRSILHV